MAGHLRLQTSQLLGPISTHVGAALHPDYFHGNWLLEQGKASGLRGRQVVQEINLISVLLGPVQSGTLSRGGTPPLCLLIFSTRIVSLIFSTRIVSIVFFSLNCMFYTFYKLLPLLGS